MNPKNINNKQYIFDSIQQYVGKKGYFLDNGSEINISENKPELYYAYLFSFTNDELTGQFDELMRGNINANKDILKILKKDYLDRTGELAYSITANNRYMNRFFCGSGMENPWKVTKEQMNDEFNNSTDNLQLACKNMVWSNRCTKVLEAILEKIADQYHSVGNVKSVFEKMTTKIMRNAQDYNQNSLTTDFIDKYTSYLYGDIDADELKQQDCYTMVDKIRSNVDLSGKISMESVFSYLSITNNQNLLYSIKDKNVDIIFKEFSKNKSKCKLCLESDNTKQGKYYGHIFKANLPGYNVPFAIHCNEKYISDLQHKFTDVIVENNDVTPPYTSITPHLFNEKQKTTIKKLKNNPNTRGEIKNIANYSNTMIEGVYPSKDDLSR